jgi:hypothetical protein
VTNTVYASGLQTGGGIIVIDGATNAVTVISTPVPSWGYVSLGAPKVNERTNTVYIADSGTNTLLSLDGVTSPSHSTTCLACLIVSQPTRPSVTFSSVAIAPAGANVMPSWHRRRQTWFRIWTCGEFIVGVLFARGLDRAPRVDRRVARRCGRPHDLTHGHPISFGVVAFFRVPR